MEYALLVLVAILIFLAGVVFSKFVIGDAIALREHITTEIAATEARLRNDISEALKKLAAKI